MPLSWNEIRDRSLTFSREWKNEASEDAEAKSFWDAFFDIFGISRRRVASFEAPVRKSDGRGGFIDLLWRGVLLVEHKSLGLDLDLAFDQAKGYFPGLKERDLPRYILVSDFARFRLYDMDEGKQYEFGIADLSKNIRLFGFIAGYPVQAIRQQDPVNIQAAEKLGRLHDLLKADGYDGHPLEVLLVRILFCLFAEDNAIFERQQFRDWIEVHSAEDFTELGRSLSDLFQVLDTAPERRSRNLNERLAAFPYINGRLFAEIVPIASFSRKMCEVLLDCTDLDWSRISPAIFGALFQSIMDKTARRNLGAHYTSETNILKALQPLFLDTLRLHFERVRRDSRRLGDFHASLRKIRILDPACGCGNFLVIAYRELRLLELDVLRELFKSRHEARLDVRTIVFVDVDQFYGIELEEFPAQIAQVALWMTDHQMNQLVSDEFGQYFARLPLVTAPNIVQDNALALDWAAVVSPKDLTYIVGNPPFVGKKEQSARQKAEVVSTFVDTKGAGVLDYVCCWYRVATEYMQANRSIRAAFVSTNSITQGEQVGVLWSCLLRRGVSINFAHRTFRWTNEARGKAAVHCVIVGFALEQEETKAIFDYETLDGDPHTIAASHINPYLLDAPDILLRNRTHPIADAPLLAFGSMPNDGGYLILDSSEREELLRSSPGIEGFVRPFIGSVEFINAIPRFCLWLEELPAQQLKRFPDVVRRVSGVKTTRMKSPREATRRLAGTPTLFGEIRQPQSNYLVVPSVSSENRPYIPMGFADRNVIANNLIFVCQDAKTYHFGVLTSLMHMSWVRAVCGRLKSDYRYSAGIVYNNFPWPEPSDRQRHAIQTAAQGVLDERALHSGATLADLYDPITMPPGLVRAHHILDRAVDVAYGRTGFKSEAERVAFLFSAYEKLTSLFPTARVSRKKRR